MFCKRCGKEIENDALFCTYCGCDLSGKNIHRELDGKSQSKILKKEFDFDYLEMNERGVKEINKWLVDKNIHIVSVEVIPRFTFFPVAQTSIRHIDIKYEEIEDNGYRYQFGVESYSSFFLEDSCKRVTKMFEKWRVKNKNKSVVWNIIKGHDYLHNNFPCNTASLYYLFQEENKDDADYRERIESLNKDIFFTNMLMFVIGVFVLLVFSFIINCFARVYF